MEKKDISEILKKELNYSDYEAEMTAIDLVNISPCFRDAVNKWLSDRIILDVSAGEFSALSLMKTKGFTYPAALIALDWVLTDPKHAIPNLRSRIKNP